MQGQSGVYKQNFIDTIRGSIEEYPKNSILKEFLQNSDDAGATELIVTFDKRLHKSMNETQYKAGQGPSLLLYNNSQFTLKDYETIVQLSKRGKEDDANATGRFGLGFTSSFSITDHPSFISNGRAYWFDILKEAVCSNIESDSTYMYCTNEQYFENQQWIDTFKIPSGCNNIENTVFRLPLRTIERNGSGLISTEVFDFDDFLEWCDEWKDNAQNLLFLRNIQKLVLQEVDENGQTHIHLKISTDNPNETQKITKKIKHVFEFGVELKNLCQKWLSDNTELPVESYHHCFSINYWDKKNTNKVSFKQEKWAVVNGLFRGENNILLKQSLKALSITPVSRKVLPWAGVAVQLNKYNQPVQSAKQLYSFLPLPIDSNYPVHIHGWFDLDSRRREITQNDEGHDKQILNKWNELLAEEAIGTAWANLVDFIKFDSNDYYKFWPSDITGQLNKSLLKGFYKKIQNKKCLFVTYKNATEWVKPTDNLSIFNKQNNQDLLKSFSEYYSIITPNTPKFINDNFEKLALISFEQITPSLIRKKLKSDSGTICFPINFADNPIKMLSTEEKVIDVLEYCSEGGDYSLLDSLPLEITCDNKLNIISELRLASENSTEHSFQNNKHLFLAPNIVDVIKSNKSLPKSWLPLTLENQLKIINNNTNLFSNNITWVRAVVDLILNSSALERNCALEEIKLLPILHLSDGSISNFNVDTDNPPLLPNISDVKHYESFELIGIKLIHKNYVSIFSKLSYSVENIFHTLTSKSFVTALLKLDSYTFTENEQSRLVCLDIMERQLKWVDTLSESERASFNKIQLFETECGSLYNLDSSNKLYLSSDFSPISNISSLNGAYKIVVAQENHRRLLKKLGIEEQNLINYLKEVVIPFTENSANNNDRNIITNWLKKQWSNKSHKNDSNLQSIVKNAKIFPTAYDGSLKPISHFYHPNFYNQLPKILQDSSFNTVHEDNSEWRSFVEAMGIQNEIISEHFLKKVQQIAVRNNVKESLTLLSFLISNLNTIQDKKIGKDSLLSLIKKETWFPVNPVVNSLNPNKPRPLLSLPANLILSSNHSIAGGLYYHLHPDVKTKGIDLSKLGIKTNISLNDAIGSFERLRNTHFDSSKRKEVARYANAFYYFIGNRKIKELPFKPKDKVILTQHGWQCPSRVFQEEVKLSGVYDWNFIIDKNETSKEGLELLGVRKYPSIDFLSGRLKELPKNQELTEINLSDANSILLVLQKHIPKLKDISSLPILSEDDKLNDPESLYINDLKAYELAIDKNNDIKFCKRNLQNLAEHLGAKSLQKFIAGEVDCNKSQVALINSNGDQQNIIKQLKSELLKSVILRLYYHDHSIDIAEQSPDLLKDVMSTEIQFYKKLVIKYNIHDTWIYTSEQASVFQSNQSQMLNVLEQKDNADLYDAIESYISQSLNLSHESGKILIRILNGNISGLNPHDFLNDRHIKTIPNQDDYNSDITLGTEIDEYYNQDIFPNELLDEQHLPQQLENEFDHITKEETIDGQEESTNTVSTNAKPSDLANNNSSTPEKNTIKSDSGNNHDPRTQITLDSDDIIGSKDTKHRNRGMSGNQSTEIGDKGENYLISNQEKYLLTPSNRFEKATKFNKGFDIYEKDKHGNVVRYIEVKAHTGPWPDIGAKVSKSQVEFAFNNKHNWWLFVIENINVGAHAIEVHQLQNPVIKAGGYMFSNSWERYAENGKGHSVNVTP